MSKQRIQELQELTARISKLDTSKLSESQLAERNTLINNIKEELTKIKEVSDQTLINYLTKVDADSRKHEKDPTKRSPEKASKSVGGFARAFNKLDARKEQGVAEGSEDLRAKLDLYNEKAFEAGHRHDDQAWRKYTKLAKQIADQLGLKYKVTGYGLEILEQGVAEGSEGMTDLDQLQMDRDMMTKQKIYLSTEWQAARDRGEEEEAKEFYHELHSLDRELRKVNSKIRQIRMGQQGVAESDLAQQMMALAKSKGMNARIAGTPDEERARTQQMLAQRAKERQEQEQQAAQADAANLPELKAKYEEMKKLYQSLGGSNWQYADREQNLSDAERKARSMEPELNRLASQIHRAEQSQGVKEGSITKSIKRSMQGWGGAQGTPGEIVKRNKAYDTDTAKQVRAGLDDAPEHSPAGLQKRVLDRKLKGVSEASEDSPVVNAITRRIMSQRVDLLSKYGPEAVGQAIDDVADYVGDFISDNDEIGTSDVSGWVRQVERVLSDSTGITTEAYDRLKKVFDFTDFKG